MPGIKLSISYEPQLENQRVTVYSLNWRRRFSGKVIKIENDIYLLRLDDGSLIGIFRQSIGAITTGPDKVQVRQ